MGIEDSMMKNNDQKLRRMLKQIDCDEQLIDIITEQMHVGDIETVRMILRRHRKILMDNLHECEKRVDDLDLFLYQMKKIK